MCAIGNTNFKGVFKIVILCIKDFELSRMYLSIGLTFPFLYSKVEHYYSVITHLSLLFYLSRFKLYFFGELFSDNSRIHWLTSKCPQDFIVKLKSFYSQIYTYYRCMFCNCFLCNIIMFPTILQFPWNYVSNLSHITQ